MPSLVTNLLAAGLDTVVSTEKPNGKKKVTALTIDNTGVAARVVEVRDRFQPSITNAFPAPGGQNPSRFLVTIGAGNVWTFDEKELRNVEILGALELHINIASATIVSTAWEEE
ncbi:hypothetical protein ES703_92012 [subsurface metagenome]